MVNNEEKVNRVDKMEENCRRSDDSINLLYGLTKVVIIVGIAIAIVVAVICWFKGINSSSKVSSILLGFIYLITITFGSIILYAVLRALVWFMYDIKVIRTVVTKSEPTDILLDFAKQNMDSLNENAIYEEQTETEKNSLQ